MIAPSTDAHFIDRETLVSQLESIKSKVIVPQEGLYGPGSMMWEIGKYSCVFVGAGRAALLQTAHPWIANAIDQHSRTKTDPYGRFKGTFTNVFTMTFGSLDKVLNSAMAVHRIHSKMSGEISEHSGAFKKGSYYQANEANAMVWVHATLWETAVKMYEMFVGPLSKQDKNRYYQETKLFAYLFGIKEDQLPPCWEEFIEYNEKMWASDVLTVRKDALDISRFIFNMHPIVNPLLHRYEIVTSIMMPERLRQQYQLPPATAENLAVYDRYIGLIKKVFPHLPRRLKYLPPYVEARRRLKGKHEPDFITGAMNRAMIGRSKLVS